MVYNLSFCNSFRFSRSFYLDFAFFMPWYKRGENLDLLGGTYLTASTNLIFELVFASYRFIFSFIRNSCSCAFVCHPACKMYLSKHLYPLIFTFVNVRNGYSFVCVFMKHFFLSMLPFQPLHNLDCDLYSGLLACLEPLFYFSFTINEFTYSELNH